MSVHKAFNHCPQCHAFLQTAENAHQSFCKHCRFPLMLIAHKYRLIEQLGEGSTATIYLAHHIGLSEDKERVIKVIKSEALNSETARLRFQREIQVTIALSRRNEHIVGIYDDFGEEPELGHFYIMEYLQGRALQDMMFDGEPLGNWLTFRIFFQLCKAIGSAHRAGIVHRDLKPENILLVERDMEPYFLKLIDFGIAKPLRRKLDLVVTQGALGTPSYMSPEQCLNKPVDGRSDIYAMGALLYELLTGHQPFVDPSGKELSRQSMLALLEAHVKQKPRSMRKAFPQLKIPAGLDQVVLRTLEKDPELRYQRVEDFWGALAPFAPPAYQQLELASQTALPALQHLTASQAALPSNIAELLATPTPPARLQAVSDLAQAPERAESAPDSTFPVGESSTHPASSQPPPKNAPLPRLPIKDRIARFQSAEKEARAQTRSPRTRTPTRDISPSSVRLPVATTRAPRTPAIPSYAASAIRREQGVQELRPSSDALPALESFTHPRLRDNQEPAQAFPAALSGPAMPSSAPPSGSAQPSSMLSSAQKQSAPGGVSGMTAPSVPSKISAPGGVSEVTAPTETSALAAPIGITEANTVTEISAAGASTEISAASVPTETAEQPVKPNAPASQPPLADEDLISAAIADVIASEPVEELNVQPTPASPAEEPDMAPLRLKRPKKILRQQALMASQATVEQSFFDFESMEMLSSSPDEDTAVMAPSTPILAASKPSVTPAPSVPAPSTGVGEVLPESPPHVPSLRKEQPKQTGDTLEENLTGKATPSPPVQASWFKAPK